MRCLRCSASRMPHTSSVLSGAHSSMGPSRSSSFGTPESQTGLMWRPRSRSFGPESVLDFHPGQAGGFGRQEMPPQGPGMESKHYKRLGRKLSGAGEVCGANRSTHEPHASMSAGTSTMQMSGPR